MNTFNFEKTERMIRRLRIKELPTFQDSITSLQEIKDMYQRLFLLITFNGRLFMATAKGRSCFLGTELLDSSIMTFESIQFCLKNGSLSDAYTLLRKLRDQSFMFLYFLAITQQYNYSLNQEEKKIDQHIKNLFDWYDEKIKFINIRTIFEYLKTDQNIKKIISEYGLENKWEKLRQKLNDHVHIKGRTNVFSNYWQGYDYKNGFKLFNEDLKYIAVSFIAVLLMVDSTIIMSTDYIDHKEMNLTPPEGSQYYIAPSIQEFINEYLKTYDNDLVDFIKETSIMDIQ